METSSRPALPAIRPHTTMITSHGNAQTTECDTEHSGADISTSAFPLATANSTTPVFPAIPVQYLLDQNERLIARIKLCYGEDIASFEDDVLALIRAYAAYVHLLPASHTRGFSDPGGLFRLGLEVGFFALQGTDAHIFCGRATISERRALEPRWRLATFIAGLCTELHLALGTLTVTNTVGEVWPACLLPLSDWLQQRQSQHYTVDHTVDMVGDAPASLASRGYGLFALPHVMPPAMLQDLASCNTVIVPQLMASISGLVLPQPRNVLDALVRRSLALVVERNLLRHTKQTGKANGPHHQAQRRHPIGLHHHRFVIDAMRHLMAFNPSWAPNTEKSRVHWGQDGLFLVWPFAGFDLIKLWEQDKLAGLPRTPQALLNFIADLELCENQAWPAQECHPSEGVDVAFESSVDAPTKPQPLVEPPEEIPKSVQLHLIRPPGTRAEFHAIRIRFPDMLLSAVEPRPVQLDSLLRFVTATGQSSASTSPTSQVSPSQGNAQTATPSNATEFSSAPPTSGRGAIAPTARRTWRGPTEAAQRYATNGSGAMNVSGTEVVGFPNSLDEPRQFPTQLALTSDVDGQAVAKTSSEIRIQHEPAALTLIAPLRLSLALRTLLNQWLATLDSPQPETAATALVVRSDGLFIPLQRFETQGFPAFEAIRALADLKMLASLGDDGSPTTTHLTDEGTAIHGIVLSAPVIQGWPPRMPSINEAPARNLMDKDG
jgi:conjugal transfer pilus assembly protein TraI